MTGRRLGVAAAAIAAVGLASPLDAQRTWVVHGAGGPGVDFVDVPPAIAASAPGDTVRVLAWNGIYSPFVIDRPLQILGVTNPDVAGFEVRDVHSGAVVVDGLDLLDARPAPIGPLTVRDCTSPVLLSRITKLVGGPDRLRIQRAASVTVWNCDLLANVFPHEIVDSHVVLAGSRLSGFRGVWFPPAVHCTGSEVTFVDSRVTGPCGRNGIGIPSVQSRASLIEVAGTSDLSGCGFSIFGECTAGPTPLWVGPAAVPPSTAGCIQTLPATAAPTVVLAPPLVRGAPTAVEFTGAPGDLVFAFAGDPTPQAVPTPWGMAWLDPATAVLLDTKLLPGAGRAAVAVTVPPRVPAGTPILFQSLLLRPGVGFRVGRPSATVVR